MGDGHPVLVLVATQSGADCISQGGGEQGAACSRSHPHRLQRWDLGVDPGDPADVQPATGLREAHTRRIAGRPHKRAGVIELGALFGVGFTLQNCTQRPEEIFKNTSRSPSCDVIFVSCNPDISSPLFSFSYTADTTLSKFAVEQKKNKESFFIQGHIGGGQGVCHRMKRGGRGGRGMGEDGGLILVGGKGA